ncbi:MAG: hypothetical protein HY666_05220 [Chloroflexi bacterium]|nr:hypothetical protein [Chloroflexota bacterium]
MATAKTRYLTDSSGRKKAVVIDLREYRGLVKRLEELEDALDLDEAVRTAKGFRDYQTIQKALRAKGNL